MSPFEQLTQRAVKRAAPRLADVVASQHRAGVAPDGTPWVPDKSGGIPRLADLGEPTAHADGASVVLELPDAFLPHQAGGRIPQRKIIPAPGDPIPDAYRVVLDEALASEGL